MTDPQAVADAYLRAAQQHDCGWRRFSDDDESTWQDVQAECEQDPDEYWSSFDCEESSMELSNGEPDLETDWQFDLVVTGGGDPCEVEPGDAHLYLVPEGNEWRVRGIDFAVTGGQYGMEFIN